MNLWAKKSIHLANQRDYLDQLYRVYPMSNNLERNIDNSSKHYIVQYFNNRDNTNLIKELINIVKRQHLDFPIKDSYVAYLKRDPTAINRNPKTINRLAGDIYSRGLNYTFDKITAPKETNRQMGPLFKDWIDKEPFGVPVVHTGQQFMSNSEDMVFNTSDAKMKDFAHKFFGYQRSKGLDFIARFHNIYVMAETKFLTDYGGHQNDQLLDALSTLRTHLTPHIVKEPVKQIAILDGVIYIQPKNIKRPNKMFRNLLNTNDNDVILSSLLLNHYLYSL